MAVLIVYPNGLSLTYFLIFTAYESDGAIKVQLNRKNKFMKLTFGNHV
jgi:hypothetical protein